MPKILFGLLFLAVALFGVLYAGSIRCTTTNAGHGRRLAMISLLINSFLAEVRYAKECVIDLGYRFFPVPMVVNNPSETMEERAIRLLTIKELRNEDNA